MAWYRMAAVGQDGTEEHPGDPPPAGRTHRICDPFSANEFVAQANRAQAVG
jgi:hypothetical protein